RYTTWSICRAPGTHPPRTCAGACRRGRLRTTQREGVADFMIPTSYYLILGALIFTVGAVGVLVRRNALIIFMCVEMMLNSVNLTLIALSRQWGNLNGQIFVFMIMAVAAAEVVVGLALLVANTRHRKSINIDEI